MSPLVMTVEEAAEHLGCGRTRVFALIRDGVVRRARRLGRRTMVFRESVEQALELPEPREHAQQQMDSRPSRATGEDWKAIGDRIKNLPIP